MTIEINNLVKDYKEFRAVDINNLEIREGEVFGFLGPNGAGKTTTISILSGLYTKFQGEIKIFGKDIRKDSFNIKKDMGVVPQDLALIDDLTAEENVTFFAKLYGLRGDSLKNAVKETLEFVGLWDRRKDFPNKFSGGMKRRLNIACAIMHEPQIIIMDEPTVGIDPQSRNHILEFTKSINKEKNTTVIYTSHYMEEVEFLCDNLSIIDLGRVLVKGSKEDIIKSFSNDLQVIVKTSNASESNIINLKSINFINNYKLAENTLTINVNRSSYDFSKLVNELSKSNINVTNFTVNEPNLETVFLGITGKFLRE